MNVLRVDVAGGETLRFLQGDDVVAERKLAPGEIAQLVRELSAAYRRPGPDLRAIGRDLYDWLDRTGDRELSRQLDDAQTWGLTLLVDVEDGLRDLPWELTASRAGFLADNGGPMFSPLRLVGEPGSAPAGSVPANRPLRLLFMAASPPDPQGSADRGSEVAPIVGTAESSRFEAAVEERGSLARLQERFRQAGPGSYDVLHLTGHAIADPGLGPVLSMQDNDDRSTLATPDELATAIAGHWPRLVVVSGTNTGESPAPLDPSFAERLVALGAPCVVAWGGQMGKAGAFFAARLYERLAEGEDVETTMVRARAAVLLAEAQHGTARYWHHVRVYTGATTIGPLVTAPGTKGRATFAPLPPGPTPTSPVASAAASPVAGSDGGGGGPAEEARTGSREELVGRRREIRWALDRLSAGPSGQRPTEGIVIHGMAGLGKSCLATRIAERLDHHRTLVHRGPLDEPGLRTLVADNLGADLVALLADKATPLVRRIGRLLDAVHGPMVFVLDDLDDSLERTADGRAPALDGHGRARLLPAAADIVEALFTAIRAEASTSRVVITCRHPLAVDIAPARLVRLGLQGLQGAEETRLLRRLPRLADRPPDEPVAARARLRAGGNPRLLHQIDDALAEAGLPPQDLVRKVDAVADAFRTSIGAGALFEGLTDGARTTLARLTVCHLPVDQRAALAITWALRIDLERAVGSSLVEAGLDPDDPDSPDGPDGGETYRVAHVVRSLAAAALTPSQSKIACSRALDYLHPASTGEDAPRDERRAREIVRLGLGAHRPEPTLAVARALLLQLVGGDDARFDEAAQLASEVLAVFDDPEVRHLRDRAHRELGRPVGQEVAR